MNRRTHTCGELTSANINEKVSLSGWVNAVRFHGQVVFVDIRDRYGKTQIVYNQDSFKGDFELVKKLSSILKADLTLMYDLAGISKKTIAPDIEEYIQSVVRKVGNLKVMVEPGRSIVGNAGIFVTKVEYLKQNDLKSFAIIDGAMNDLQRPSLYGSYHQAIAVEDNSKGIKDTWDLVGPICETGDFIGKNRSLSLSEGDLLAIFSAGAYGFSMSSNYNSRPRAAEILVDGVKVHEARKREKLEDLFGGELLP